MPTIYKSKIQTSDYRPLCIDRNLFSSPAYLSFPTPSCYIVYGIFLTKRVMKNIGTMRKPKWIIANNGGITFTYREEWESYRISEYKFEKAIANLIKAGLLDLVQPGRYRQPALYALSEHWKKCGTEDFVRQSVTKQSHRGGFQKGNKLGRNSTLQERTAYLQQQRQQKIEPIESKIEALKTEQQLSIEHKTSSRIPAIVDARIDYYSELLNKTKGI